MSENSTTSSRTHSVVWSHFTIIEDEQKAQCNYCGVTYKRTGGNTTNLHKHLLKKHPGKIEKVTENTGPIDKYVTGEVPVSIYNLYI
jgi:hypothetical protein